MLKTFTLFIHINGFSDQMKFGTTDLVWDWKHCNLRTVLSLGTETTDL